MLLRANAALAECARLGLPAPLYNAYSDRRGKVSRRSSTTVANHMNPGGRTAWSSSVTVEDWNCTARHWYDGQFIHNAREDAAEVMLTKLRNPAVYGTPRRQQSSSGGRHSAYGAR